MTSRLKGKWVLVTGTSSGFGAAAARAFGAEGAKVLLGARRMDRLETVAIEARHAGAAEAHFHALDVSHTASVGLPRGPANESTASRPPAVGCMS